MSTILVVDSGLGGATIVKQLIKTNKKVNFIFHCENANAPLGNLSKTQLTQLIKGIIDKYIKKYNLGLIVLACNTLTVATINQLRKMYTNIKIVGVEPNVKVTQGKTIVLATKYTINNCQILKDKSFIKIALPELSVLIDKYYPNLNKCLPYLKEKLGNYKKVNNIVLGCTHYFLLKEQLRLIFKNVTFYTSVEGVVKRIKALYNIDNNSNGGQSIFLSKKNSKLYKAINNYLHDNTTMY